MDALPKKLFVTEMTANLGIFKEPRGAIRLLQFIFAIFAFATASSGGSSLSIRKPNVTDAITVTWSYPYDLQSTPILTSLSKTREFLSLANDIKPSAEFFVFTGVTSMLISLALAIVYVFLDRQYRNDERYPIGDFLLTLIWTIFWIAGSSAWAQGVSNIRSQTSTDYVMKLVPACNVDPKCVESDWGTYANITVSVIFGFLNFMIWLGSLWFVYKETKFFKSRTAQQQQQQPPQQTNFSNLAAPPPTQIRPPGSIS